MQEVFQALSSESRLKIIKELLKKDEICVCEFSNLVNLDASTVSRHISELERTDIVETKKQGKCVICFLKNKKGVNKLFGVVRSL